uniref:Lines homolog 1 n=1 Tax=Oryzias sinensis TaxID=183150 RepID=A0A8C7X0S6_9TELE
SCGTERLLWGPHREMASVCLQSSRYLPQVEQFQSSDPLLSHLAAKTAACWVVRVIRRGVGVPPTWYRTCERTFLSCSVGPELDSCLWSLTEVFLLLSSDVLEELLAELHRSISALCSALLPDRTASHLPHRGTTLCLLLDLLEVLMASSLQCGGKAGPGTQNLGWAQWPGLLGVVGFPSEPFVKRRTLLLLKRALLHKAGEGRSTPPHSEFGHAAQSVLAAVDAGWLDSIQVESDTFFGGRRFSWGGREERGDEVLLRALSLVLLSTEAGCVSLTEMGGASKPHRYLQHLWGFLRRWVPPQIQVKHLCCYISVLFGEQDDDLMEAARAFLAVFLSCRGGLDLDASQMLEAACSLGCNPHCHFVLLLQSFSFDHSLLLDFLICSETCFLEYLVRYLRHLRKDWKGLAAACGALEELQQPVGGCTGGGLCAGSGSCVQAAPTGPEPSTSGSGPSSTLRLVEYYSSDESAEEKEEESSALTSEHSSQSSGQQAPDGPVDQHLLDRTVRCLSELRGVVFRLHSRKLFPYNPSSLLKLLADVEAAGDDQLGNKECIQI